MSDKKVSTHTAPDEKRDFVDKNQLVLVAGTTHGRLLRSGYSVSRSTPSSAATSHDRLGILADLNVTLSARLGATSQPLGAVLSMQPGTIVDLGRGADAPIELVANGVVVAYGEVVAVGSSLGVRVTGLAA